MKTFSLSSRFAATVGMVATSFALGLHGAEAPSSLEVRPSAEVDGEGVFLSQLVEMPEGEAPLRLSDAPAFGKTTNYTRATLGVLLKAASHDWAVTNWTGAQTVRVSRKVKQLADADVLQMLVSTLQQTVVKDRGDLELRMARGWTTLSLPDEPLTLKMVDMPASGLTSVFVARFQLVTARGEVLGLWTASVQARVMREMWVARTPIKRGEMLSVADVIRENRDVLQCHDVPAEFSREDSTLEIGEAVGAGAPLLARNIRLRAVIHRGQNTAALLQDGAMMITLRVEALEDGAPGQIIRARNPLSMRDIRGKVINEQTISVTL